METKEKNITFRINTDLKKLVEVIAQQERRTLSSQLRVILEEWINMKKELHPQFLKAIKESVKSGKPEPVWKG